MYYQDALKEAIQDLRPHERERLLQFRTHQELWADLKKIEEANANQRHFIGQIFPYLNTMKDLSSMLLLYMRPFAPETAVLWTALHLTVNVNAIQARTTRRNLANFF
jgi:hypothetical protein